jgi:hypothetical protein
MMNREQRAQALKWRLMLLDIMAERERSRNRKSTFSETLTEAD